MTRFVTLAGRFLAGVAFIALSAAPARAGAVDIAEFTLDNGLRLVVVPDHRAPVVTHMAWYRIGSADEPAGKSGIAHFFEHLMFKGTKTHPAGEFSAAVAEIGGEENAFTSYDYTAYYQQVAPSALESMMAFESDRMRNLVLTDDVIGPERDVILEERRMRIDNSPEAVLDEEIDATMYQNHPYGVPVIGWLHEMEQLNRVDAVDFYDRYYAPNNAIVVIAGDVKPEEARAIAERTYGKVPRGPELPPRIRPEEPEQNTKRTVTLADARVSVPTFRTQWLAPSYRTAEKGEAEALDLLSEILGGGLRSRLYQELVVKRGIAANAGAWYMGDAIDDTIIAVTATPRGDATLEEVEKAVMDEVARIAAEGVTADELAAAKKRYVRSLVFARDDQSDMARIYGTTLATGGTVADVAEWPARIEAVGADAVKAAAQKYLDAGRSVTGYLLPKQDKAG
ncbi:MAG: insulinase family protein [Phyllobacteriaceae bacterium]|nr:insulinase family protein [Phyllobacteriaceae bacterium]